MLPRYTRDAIRGGTDMGPSQCTQNVDVNGPHHRCFELIVSSSFNQPMAVERRRSHELVGSMVGAVYVHVLRTLAQAESGSPKEPRENEMSLVLRGLSKTSWPMLVISDPRTWELAAPTIDASSSLCLPYSTNLWQSSKEEAMSWWGLWWGSPAPTFCDHCLVLLSLSLSPSSEVWAIIQKNIFNYSSICGWSVFLFC